MMAADHEAVDNACTRLETIIEAEGIKGAQINPQIAFESIAISRTICMLCRLIQLAPSPDQLLTFIRSPALLVKLAAQKDHSSLSYKLAEPIIAELLDAPRYLGERHQAVIEWCESCLNQLPKATAESKASHD